MSQAPTRGRRRARREGAETSARQPDYHTLRHPFPQIPVFTEDRVAAIHDTALKTLEDLGMTILSAEARDLFRRAGALVDDDAQTVHIGRDIVQAAIATAPRSFTMKAGAPEKDLLLELGAFSIQAGGGCPNATDLVQGRRPGALKDFDALTRLAQHFDALQMIGPSVEPQDMAPPVRHYATMRSVLRLTNKVPFLFSRGTAQVEDGFEMIRMARGIDRAAFEAEPHVYTIINTNSPRQIDVPMAQGLMDFARAGQMAVVTPFCLMGAMAPITVAGALTLSHAEALAGITLNQLANPGAPVCYGAFASNVDMKSGAPAFGTPEQVKANLGSGQLARLVGLPWRCAAGCAANINDAQAANETQMSAWSAMLAGCTIMLHGAGWIEGGLTLSFEKLITDMEVMQIFAELCAPTPVDDAAIAYEALMEVAPGGHFFAADHTMERYQTAFYQPLVADWSNFGTWTERGAQDASTRATGIWRKIVDAPEATFVPADRLEQIDAFIARRTAEGGAPPVD